MDSKNQPPDEVTLLSLRYCVHCHRVLVHTFATFILRNSDIIAPQACVRSMCVGWASVACKIVGPICFYVHFSISHNFCTEWKVEYKIFMSHLQLINRREPVYTKSF